MKPVTTPNKEFNTSSKKENSTPRPSAAWKYIHPADKNQTIIDQSKKLEVLWKMYLSGN